MWPQTATSRPRRRLRRRSTAQQLFEPIERHDHVGRGLLDARVDVALRPADPLVDRRRHRLAHRQQLRHPARVARHRDLDASSTPASASRRQNRHQRRVRRDPRSRRAADLVERLRRVGAGGSSSVTSSAIAAPAGSRTPIQRVDAVLASDAQATAHPCARWPRRRRRGDRACATCSRAASSQARARAPGAAVRSENGTSARHCAGRPRSTRSVTAVTTPSVPSDPMNRSMRSMPGRGEIAGRQLGQPRHPVAREPARALVPRRQLELEVAVGLRPRGAALDVQHVAGRQHDRQRLDPVARRAVLECRGAGGVGGHRPADEGAREGRRRRVEPACRLQRAVRAPRACTPAPTRTRSAPNRGRCGSAASC